KRRSATVRSGSIRIVVGSIRLLMVPGRSVRPELAAEERGLPRPGYPYLVLHRLLLDQPGHDLAGAGEGREVHDRLHRQRWHASLWRRELSREAAAQHSGRQLLVGDAV